MTCKDCLHYYITYDPNNPNGCKIFNFKAKKMPIQILLDQGEKSCLAFEDKIEKKYDKKNDSINYDDDKFWK